MGIDVSHILRGQMALLEGMGHAAGRAPPIFPWLCQVQAVTGHAEAQHLHAAHPLPVCGA